jgi:hypothetical protein
MYTEAVPVSSAGRPTTSTAAVETRVRFQQQKAARAHDRRTRATPTLLTAGDWVRIRLPKRGHKLAPVYTEPHMRGIQMAYVTIHQTPSDAHKLPLLKRRHRVQSEYIYCIYSGSIQAYL